MSAVWLQLESQLRSDPETTPETAQVWHSQYNVQLVSDKLHPTPTQPHIGAKSGACDSLTD